MVKDSLYKICIVPTALHESGARSCYGLKSVGIKKIEPMAQYPFSTLIPVGTHSTLTHHTQTPYSRGAYTLTLELSPPLIPAQSGFKNYHRQQRGIASTHTTTTDFNPLLDGK